MVKFAAIFASFAAAPLLASALPSTFTPRSYLLPRGTYKVARDDQAKRLIAFDIEGRELGIFPFNANVEKRVAGTCVAMSNDDISKVPGIQKMRDEADKNWGTGKRNEVVNDKDLPDSPANICGDDSGVVLTYDGNPSCTTVQNAADGQLEGGTITLENNEGQSMTSTTTVTKSSSFSVSTKIGASFSFPEIADVSTEITTTGEFSNTLSDATALTSDDRTLQRIEQPVDDGSQCSVQLTTKSCQIIGKGSIDMEATGMLWFEYEDKVQGHFKWGLVWEAILPNKADRSSPIEFKATGKIESHGHFSADSCSKKATVTKA